MNIAVSVIEIVRLINKMCVNPDIMSKNDYSISIPIFPIKKQAFIFCATPSLSL